MMKRAFAGFLLRWCCIALAGLAVLVLAVGVWGYYREKRGWEKYKREAEARGVSFDVRTFIPPPVPDEQNFAMTPLLKPLFGPDKEYGPALEKRLKLTGTNPNTVIPGIGGMWEGKRDDLTKWRDYLGRQDLLQALKKFDPELDEISFAVRRPFARFPLRYEDGIAMRCPHFPTLLAASRLYELRAAASLEAGKTERALADVESIFRIAESIGSEPTFISQLVRVSLLHMGLQIVWEGLAAHQWSESQLVTLQGWMEQGDLLVESKKAFGFEMASFSKTVQQVANDPKLLVSLSSDHPALDNRLECLRNPLRAGMPWVLLNSCSFEEKHLLRVVDPVGRRVNVSQVEEGQKRLDAFSKCRPDMLLLKLMFPACVPVIMRISNTQTKLDEAAIACALERYHSANGAFPETLDALVPHYMAKLSHDIINGEPLHYRRTPDGLYLLYSVGWNGIDDNGTVAKAAKRQDLHQGDWAWFCAPQEK